MAAAIRRAPWADGSICRTKSAALAQTLRRSSTSTPARAAARTIWSFRRLSGTRISRVVVASNIGGS
jgi:hypothetical protein